MRRLTILLSFLALALSPVVAAAQQIAWLDTQYGAPLLRRANLNGTGLSSWALPAGSLPEGLAFDATRGRLIWVESAWSGARVRRASLDLILTSTVVPGLSALRGVAVDPASGRIYWTSSNLATGGLVQRAEADGSGVVTLLALGLSANPRAIALDLVHAKLYFTDFDQGLVRRANFDGTLLETIATTPVNAGPYGIAVDPAANRVYWSEYGYGVIRRANLDGGSPEDLFGTALPTYLALDVAGGQIYWASGIYTNLLRGPLFGGVITVTALPCATYGGMVMIPASSLAADGPAPVREIGFAVSSSNPARGPVTFELALPFPANARVTISDVQGRRIATLADGTMPAGRTSLVWARAARSEAAAGIYFARLETAGRSWVRRVAAIR